MPKFLFRIAVAVLLTTMLALFFAIGVQSPEFQAQRAKQQAEQERITKIKKDVDQEVNGIKRERDAWCAANKEAVNQALHVTVIKIEDGYMRELPQVPLTTV